MHHWDLQDSMKDNAAITVSYFCNTYDANPCINNRLNAEGGVWSPAPVRVSLMYRANGAYILSTAATVVW